MAKNTLYNYNPIAPTTISREQYTDVGSGDNILGDVKRAFLGSTDFEIWTAPTSGTQLSEDTDYELINMDSDYTADAGYNVYTGFKILNASYQTGNIYITYKCIGSYVDADTINDLITVTEDIAPIYGKRQTVLTGSVDTSGLADFIAAGSGLSATASASESEPLIMTWANGVVDAPYDYKYTATGSLDFSSLMAYANTFLYAQNDGLDNITTGHSVYAPVYDTVFKGANAGAILANFEGTHGATTYTDAFNNVWTLANGAALSNSQKKFNATTSLYFAGTDDYAQTTAPDMSGKWTIEFWARCTDVTNGGSQILLTDSANYRMLMLINSSGKIVTYLSSNGSSYNIQNGAAGNTTLSDATWYHIAWVFNGSNYKLYLNGSEETNHSATSSSSIVQPSVLRFGVDSDGTSSDYTGYFEGIRFSPYARYTANFTAPAAAFTADEQHFFDLSSMKMYRGYPSAWTETLRLFIGECATGASSISSSVTYSLNGRYDSGWYTVANSTIYTKSHNTGYTNGNLVFDVFFSKEGVNRNCMKNMNYYLDNSGNTYGVRMTHENQTYFGRLNLSYVTGGSSICAFNGSSQTTGYHKIIAQRGW